MTRNSIAPSSSIVPAKTSSPSRFSTGTDSPVMGAWLTEALPFVIWPSRGMRSPGLTRTVAPSGTSSTGFSMISPS